MKIPHTGFLGNSSNHEFRSGYIQWLLHQNNISKSKKEHIPKVLIQFWDDLETLPNDVLKCLNSWKPLQKFGFKIVLFCDETAQEFIKREYTSEYLLAYNKCNHPAMKCDYFRLCYLYRYGGGYVDADEIYLDEQFQEYFTDSNLKIQPLCYDISVNEMLEVSEFINDKTYLERRIFYVNNNPIISPAKHPLLDIALKNATMNLLNHNKDTKFDIQSTTGPGNLTASLVDYAIRLKSKGKKYNFSFIRNWNSVSKCEWFLEYRNDNRNWRNY